MTTPPVDLYHHPYDIEAATCRDGLDLEETLRVEPQESTSRHEVYRRHRSYGPNYAMFRTNLAVLSQFYNLYFVAEEEEIYVYVPSSRSVPALPVLIIKPEVKNPSAQGYLFVHRPRIINTLVIGELGDEELVLSADDAGNVTGYRTRDIFEWVERGQKLADIHARVDVHPPIKPFFREWVGMSAWGLAIHKTAKLIAVSSNTHNIAVYAFAQRDESSENPEPDGGGDTEEEDTWDFILTDFRLQTLRTPEMRKQQRRRNIRLLLRGHPTNIPSISFVNSEADPHGNWLLSTDIDNNLYLWRIWEVSLPVRIFRFQNQVIDDYQHLTPVELEDQGGWCTLALDHRNFRPQKSLRHACGGQPRRLFSRSNVATFDMSALGYVRQQQDRQDTSPNADSLCEVLDLDSPKPSPADDPTSIPLPPAVKPVPYDHMRNLDFIGTVSHVNYIPVDSINDAGSSLNSSPRVKENVRLLIPGDRPNGYETSLPWFFDNDATFDHYEDESPFTLTTTGFDPREERPPDITPAHVERWLTFDGSEDNNQINEADIPNFGGSPFRHWGGVPGSQRFIPMNITTAPPPAQNDITPADLFFTGALDIYRMPILAHLRNVPDTATDVDERIAALEREIFPTLEDPPHEDEDEDESQGEGEGSEQRMKETSSFAESGSDDSKRNHLSCEELISSFAILQTSEKDVRLISSPSSSKPNLIFRQAFSSLKRPRARVTPRPSIKYAQQIPELGVVVVATSECFAMVYSMTDVQGSKRKYLRAEARLPFDRQLDEQKRPASALVGLSVSPVPCHLHPSKPITPQPRDLEGIQNLQNDTPSFDQAPMRPATNLGPVTDEAWKDYEPTRRYRLFLLYQDNDIYSYQLSLDTKTNSAEGPSLQVVE